MTDKELLEQILSEVNAMYEDIRVRSLEDNTDIMKENLSIYTTYYARASQIYADTQRIVSEARAYWSENIDSKIQATRFREILEGKIAQEVKVHTLVDRLLKTLNHLIDTTITKLSFAKAEMTTIHRSEAITKRGEYDNEF